MGKRYSQFTVVDDIKINGKLTLGAKDVADLGGTLLAYIMEGRQQGEGAATGRRLHSRSTILHRHGAMGLRQPGKPENLRVNALTDPHSPNEYRVNGVVSNMPEFQAAFSCKLGAADGAGKAAGLVAEPAREWLASGQHSIWHGLDFHPDREIPYS